MLQNALILFGLHLQETVCMLAYSSAYFLDKTFLRDTSLLNAVPPCHVSCMTEACPDLASRLCPKINAKEK